MIDNIDGFINSLINNSKCEGEYTNADNITKKSYTMMNYTDDLFCPYCGAERKHVVERHSSYISFDVIEPGRITEFSNLPLVYNASCLQCGRGGVLVIYQGPERLELAVLRNTYGGCVTPNTPIEVKYYLDQAYRARMVSALSAAMTMYRSALEWILYDQGYTEGMLGKKINNLESDINNNMAPEWASQLSVEIIRALKNIGNGATHTNKGDIEKQKEIDKNLMELIDIIFSELLDIIYEQPARRLENLNKLKSVSDKFNG